MAFGLFFKVTGIALVILSVKLLLGGVLEFGEAGMIPLGHEAEEVLEFIAEDAVSEVLSAIVVALPLGVFTFKIIQGFRERTVNL